jgi:glycosyltransferase involved in cell wall biosynthesis
MCTYNGSKYLQPQLQSIGNQSTLPDELVICDDQSSDSTQQIACSFAERVPFPVRFHANEIRLGTTRNFERAITLAEGDIIVLCDQDDVWSPNKLEVMEAAFGENPHAVLVFSDADVVDSRLQPLGYGLWESLDMSVAGLSMIRSGRAWEALLRGNFVTGATMAFRGNLKRSILPISEQWVHDEWIVIVLAMLGQLVPIDERLVLYRQHANNQLGTQKWTLRDKLNLFFRARNDFYRQLEQKRLDLRRHLTTVLGMAEDDPRIRAIDRQMAHFALRAELPDRAAARLAVVARETLNGNYARFSGGARSVLRDLIGPIR